MVGRSVGRVMSCAPSVPQPRFLISLKRHAMSVSRPKGQPDFMKAVVPVPPLEPQGRPPYAIPPRSKRRRGYVLPPILQVSLWRSSLARITPGQEKTRSRSHATGLQIGGSHVPPLAGCAGVLPSSPTEPFAPITVHEANGRREHAPRSPDCQVRFKLGSFYQPRSYHLSRSRSPASRIASSAAAR